MQHYEFNWKNPAGKQIYAQGWTPDGKPKAVLLIQHGLGEHSGRYEHVAEFFTSKGYAVLANDRVGHGKSKGKRGHVARYDQLLDDVVKLHSEATRKFGSLPVYLYGHSMGGNVVLNYLHSNPKNGLKGIIASSPALQLAFEPPAVKLALGKFMRSIYGAFSQQNELETKHLSRDPEVVKAYKQDPLVHDKVTAETAIGMLQTGKDLIAKAGKTGTPLLLLHGSDDKIISAEGTKKYANKATGDVSIKIFEGTYHEPHNDLDKEEVLQTILDWIQDHH